MKLHKILLWAAACTAPLTLPSAWAHQWQWLDHNGNKVFSDRAPPADVPESKILKQPKGAAARKAMMDTNADPEAETPAKETPAAPQISGKDKELEKAKAKAEAEEAAKQKKEEAERARLRAENCKSARNVKTTLQSGHRLSHYNDKGEKVIMDDATRNARLRQAEKIIASDCK